MATDETDPVIEPDDPSEHVRNPATGQREDVSELPRTGYKRRYLELLRKHRRLKGQIQNAVELEGTLTFEKDKWDFQDDDGHFVLQRREWDEETETHKLLTYRKEVNRGF